MTLKHHLALCLSLILTALCSVHAEDTETSASLQEESGLKTTKALAWHEDLEAGLTLAGAEYRPVLALFTSPDCVWCLRLKAELIDNQNVSDLLQHFVLVEIDVSNEPGIAAAYQVRGVPTTLILSSDGSVRTGAAGYATAAQLQKMLASALNVEYLRKTETAFAELTALLDKNALPPEKWPEVAASMGCDTKRDELSSRIYALNPFPRVELATLLSDRSIAVRLGAIEILEELTGDTFGYDPWDIESDESAAAILKWKKWAGSDDAVLKPSFSALTREQAESYIRDLISENRERSKRAIRMFARGGAGTGEFLSEFLEQNPDISTGARNKIREAQYLLYISEGSPGDPANLAHRLIFGTTDVRLKSISELNSVGIASLPILRECLEDNSIIIRETAVDVLVNTAGPRAVHILREHLEREKDNDVKHAVLKGLGQIRTRGSLNILTSYLDHANEDLVTTALDSMARLKSKTAREGIEKCLADPRWRVRVAALNATARIPLRELADKVAAMLNDEDEFVRYTAVITLGALSAKKAVPELEAAFMREDGLKAAVTEAFYKMNVDPPDRFRKALQDKNTEIIMAVIEAAERSYTRNLDLICRYVYHDNLDIACTAIRLLASRGMKNSNYQSMLVNVLREKNTTKTMAALTSISIDKNDMRNYPEITRHWTTPQADDEDTTGPGELETLFDAFGSSAPQPKPDSVATRTVTVTNPGETGVKDVFQAFSAVIKSISGGGKPVSTQTGHDSPETTVQDFTDLIAEIEACMNPEKDKEIQFHAALVLAGLGNPGAIPFIEKNLANRPSSERRVAARNLGAIQDDRTLPILRSLLQDPSRPVRSAAARSCFERSDDFRYFETVLEELTGGGRLKPHEVFDHRFRSALNQEPAKRSARNWIKTVLSGTYDEQIQNLALMLLEYCWTSESYELMKKFLDSQSQWQRRAAFRALGKGDQKRFTEKIRQASEDSSEYVRVVVPNIYQRSGARWINYFDAKHFTHDYHHSFSGRTRRLAPEVRDVLNELAADASPQVRLESCFALLTNNEPIDLRLFVQTIETIPDRSGVASRLASYLTMNHQSLDQSFGALLPYVEQTWVDEESMNKMRLHFNVTAESEETEEASASTRQRPGFAVDRRETRELTESSAETREDSLELTLVYFTSAGCRDCERVERILPDLHNIFPYLEIQTHDIRKIEAIRFNETLCERFSVPENIRLVTPAVFSGAGYLIGREISADRLVELLSRSIAIPDETWLVMLDEDADEAEKALVQRYETLPVLLVLGNGLIDGINPCAFATLIFLLSYLQVAKRKPNELLQVAAAFTIAVFLTYFALGLGLAGIAANILALRTAGMILNWFMAGFALVIMILNIRDGILCLRGKLEDTTLQLPEFLKNAIRVVIRHGARQRHFVIAAFIIGAVISLLELACTGQVYAPTIGFIVKTRGVSLDILWMLALYNIAFVTPLIIVFILAKLGMKAEKLTATLKKHAAAVKFATAGLFLVLFIFFVMGDTILAFFQ